MLKYKEFIKITCLEGIVTRLVDERMAFCLARVKADSLRFSFDDIDYEKDVREGVKLLGENGVRSRKLSF